MGSENYALLWIRGGFPRSFLSSNESTSIIWREDFVRTFSGSPALWPGNFIVDIGHGFTLKMSLSASGESHLSFDIPSIRYSSLDHLLKQFFLFEGHLVGLFLRSLMFITDQVEDAVDEEEDEHLHLGQAGLS